VKKIVTIVGARPQFIKAAIVSRALAKQPDVEESLVHTGQHYDERMSEIFFEQLGIPCPRYRLKIGSGTHGLQTGRMLAKIEEVLLKESPDAVLVYGDTNSTLAGALAAAKLPVPVVHVESGLRSFNRQMPEETNRVLTDHISSLLLCPTPEAVKNLAIEGLVKNVHLVGDVMYDSAMFFSKEFYKEKNPLTERSITKGEYVLLTCHRAENTDDPARLAEIQQAIRAICRTMPVVFPVHPRMDGRLKSLLQAPPSNLIASPPVSYFEMLQLTKHAAVVVTDSGGLQKEAFFFGVPCVTMRDETEWNETVSAGANVIVGANADRIIAAVDQQQERRGKLPDAGSYYGNGRASKSVAKLVATLP